jgi:hypothetical protein
MVAKGTRVAATTQLSGARRNKRRMGPSAGGPANLLVGVAKRQEAYGLPRLQPGTRRVPQKKRLANAVLRKSDTYNGINAPAGPWLPAL